MRVVGIETSGTIGSVALWEEGRTVAEEAFQRGLVHGKALIPTLARLLEQAHWERASVGLFAVSQGPGSYTGIRVGVATAKALAYAQRVPLVGVCTLDALAQNPPPSRTLVAPVVDARWEQVYTALYEQEEGRVSRLSGPRAVRPEQLARELPAGVHLFGDGVSRYRSVFTQSDASFGSEEEWVCHARVVADLAAQAFSAGQRDDPFSLAPLYLRPTEAEVKAGRAAV